MPVCYLYVMQLEFKMIIYPIYIYIHIGLDLLNTLQKHMYMYIKHNNYLVVAKLVRVPAFQHSSFVKVVGVH